MSEPRQLSPDGKWWWDGQKWQPVEQAPAQVPPPQPPVKKRSWGWLLAGVVVALIVMGVCIAALANSGGQRNTATSAQGAKPAATVQPIPTQTPTATPRQATADPRGTCSPPPCANDNYGWIVNIANVKYGVTSPNQFEHPEAGNTYVTLEVTFTNKLTREQHANPTSFVLLDGAGVKHTVTSTTFCSLWSPVNVTQGASYGPKCMVFEAAADKPAGLVLVWTPSGFGGGYNIKLS